MATPFGEYLAEKEISVAQAAEQLDVTKSYVHLLVNGDVTPSYKLAWNIEVWTEEAVVMQTWAAFIKGKDVRKKKAKK